MEKEPIKVGMAEMQTALNPDRLITIGLGSCVGVCLWDPISKIGGMVHVMLPDSTQGRNVQNKAKYADSGIIQLIEYMTKLGSRKTRIIAKIAGGAQMFNFSQKNEILRIGERNVQAVKKVLNAEGIRITAEDTGGTYGRTIVFSTIDAQLLIRSVNKNTITL
ncbi:MAG: chemotaxis protein CheD [Firmicutes bacterium HGW-Firmicutes-12]|jgi:chemotaxis protein CheD|nr:MAG: chemotaxis protein CheD [Firmicutes bacterium HGW-Firmicutes-12]